MKFKLPDGMIEATRLTREGRLSEATGLIQRILRGRSAPAEQAGPAASALSPSIIDLVAEKTETLEPSKASDGATGTAEAKPASANGQFLNASFANAAGTRAYKLYVPGSYSGKPLPLIVMLHGCTQSAEDFAAGTGMNAMADAKGFFVAYPEQPASANPNRCWNWFNPSDQQRDSGEASLIAGIAREISAKYAVDGKRIYAAGLSAGGAAAAIMASAYPDLFAAVGVHSGLPAGSAKDVASALAAMSNPKDPSGLPHGVTLHGRARLVPTIVFHGDKDTTVHPRNAHHVIHQSQTKESGDLRAVSHHGHVPEGRTYTRTEHRDAAGRAVLEMWTIHGAGHAWSGGKPEGSFTDPRGPDASAEMVRFFLQHPRAGT